MPKFRFKWTSSTHPDGFWEEYDEASVTCAASAARLVARWIEDFNAVEARRYGEKATLRTVDTVEFLGYGPA